MYPKAREPTFSSHLLIRSVCVHNTDDIFVETNCDKLQQKNKSIHKLLILFKCLHGQTLDIIVFLWDHTSWIKNHSELTFWICYNILSYRCHILPKSISALSHIKKNLFGGANVKINWHFFSDSSKHVFDLSEQWTEYFTVFLPKPN